MQLVWVGCHAEGIPALEALVEAGAPIRAVLTLTPELAAKRSAAADYGSVCERLRLPLHYISNINERRAVSILCQYTPDIVFVIGWHQMVRVATLRLARIGMIGAHASLLPHNRGSAPINWAIIRGEPSTGNTLCWLAEDVNGGDIIDQVGFPITLYDTCATLYQKVAASNRSMLLRVLPRLLAGERPGVPQPPEREPLLPRRRPADGNIDWSATGKAVYDFVRALTKPYPGAFSVLDGRRWYIWSAALLPLNGAIAAPGTIVGPVWSPKDEVRGQLVACGNGGVILLELSDDRGEPLSGRALSDQLWAGKQWKDS